MRRWLDRVTGAMTMYRLVLVLLTGIALIALLLSLVGQLGAGAPLALLASAVVAIGVSLAASWLGARVLRLTAHTESALITGLLVFFVMQPKLDPLGLAGIAIAAAIAGFSKSLIAIRGRHVFNPAALGAFVVSVIVFASFVGFSFASWWIGTPLLLLPVTIAAFLVLYRTQKLTVAGVFLVLAAAIGIGGALLRGADLGEALSQVLLQSPLVFFAGFMLSEPLTLPPRRWQQLTEAAAVAAVMMIPFSLGPVANTPQFALLLGNLLAFAFGQRRGISLRLLGKRQLGASSWELEFQPSRRLRFAPGQYLELSLPHRAADFRGSRRYFSISSAPRPGAPLSIAITVPNSASSFKAALLELPPGSTVQATGIHGDFTLPRDPGTPLLLVAGGIGITPFASQLADLADRGQHRDVVVVYSYSAPGPLPYAELLQRSGVRVLLFAPEAPSPLPAGWSYGGVGRPTHARLAESVPDVDRRHVYLSGPPALVGELRAVLRGQGHRRVHTDSFSGY